MLARLNVFIQLPFVFLWKGINVEGNAPIIPSLFRRQSNSLDDHFRYVDTEEWDKDNPTCSGDFQSPIDILTKDLNYLPRPRNLIWNGWEKTPSKMTLQNNGHTVQLSMIWNNDRPPSIVGGTLGGEYTFEQLHFHWGPTDDSGSEHMIDGRKFPLEMHLVHYKNIYGSMSKALRHKDGLAVVGVLYELSENNNTGISELHNYASSIENPLSEVEIEPFPLSKFDVKFQMGYATYFGSLTTPPCTESVKWILWSQARDISNQQIQFFRSIKLANGDDHNYRTTKLLNGRTVDYVKNY